MVYNTANMLSPCVYLIPTRWLFKVRVIFCYIHGSLCDYPLKDLGAVEISSDEEGGPPASLTSGTNALNMQIIYKALEEIKKSLDMYLTRWIFSDVADEGC